MSEDDELAKHLNKLSEKQIDRLIQKYNITVMTAGEPSKQDKINALTIAIDRNMLPEQKKRKHTKKKRK